MGAFARCHQLNLPKTRLFGNGARNGKQKRVYQDLFGSSQHSG